MSDRKLLFVFNPKSGKGLIKNQLVEIIDIMVKAGFDVTTYPTQYQGDATRKIEEEGIAYDRIVCSGGDGTLDEVVTGMRRKHLHIPLGYIPTGSTNDFAKSIGVSNDMLEAARIAVGDNIFPCDVGKFNDDTFIYIAGFGLFTDVSYNTPQELKNIFGHMAYILSAASSLAAIPTYMMQIEVNGEVIRDRFIYGMISNATSVGGFKGITGKNVELNDGEFEATFVKCPANPIELNEIIAFLSGLITESSMVYTFKTDHVHIRSRQSVAWTLDGEFGGDHWEADIEALYQKIDFLVKQE